MRKTPQHRCTLLPVFFLMTQILCCHLALKGALVSHHWQRAHHARPLPRAAACKRPPAFISNVRIASAPALPPSQAPSGGAPAASRVSNPTHDLTHLCGTLDIAHWCDFRALLQQAAMMLPVHEGAGTSKVEDEQSAFRCCPLFMASKQAQG